MQDAKDPAVSLVCSLFLTGVSLLWCKRDKHSSWITPCLSCSVITIIKQALAQQSSPDSRHWLCCYTCTSHQVLASQLWPPAHSHSPPASTHFQLTVALPYTIFTSERCWGARQWGGCRSTTVTHSTAEPKLQGKGMNQKQSSPLTDIISFQVQI